VDGYHKFLKFIQFHVKSKYNTETAIRVEK